jgi:hypothetical protein
MDIDDRLETNYNFLDYQNQNQNQKDLDYQNGLTFHHS